MTIAENPTRVDSVELKRDLQKFVEAISPVGIDFGLNPHLEQVRIPESRSSYRATIAVISESGPVGAMKKIVGRGNVARILEAPPNVRGEGIDYFFVYGNVHRNVLTRLFQFTGRVEKTTGVSVFLTAKNNHR